MKNLNEINQDNYLKMIINQVIEKACDMSVNSMSLENYNYVEDIKPV